MNVLLIGDEKQCVMTFSTKTNQIERVMRRMLEYKFLIQKKKRAKKENNEIKLITK